MIGCMLFIKSFLLTLVIGANAPVDQTKFLQQLLDKNAGKALVFPAGTYLVKTLTVPKQTRLTITSKTIIKGMPSEGPLPILTLGTDVYLTGGGLIDGNRTQRKKGTGLQAFDAQNVRIENLRIREIAEQAVQLAGCKKVVLRNLQIVGCGAKGVSQAQGINIVTSQDIAVANCSVAKAQHGIQWWGDDKSGWCENIRISNNQVRDVEAGGIWGNKGRAVTVVTNRVTNCGDVGIDFEHSIGCSATSNQVQNCKNYALAVFYGSEQIQFIQNTVNQGITYGHGLGLVGDGLNKHISLKGGVITINGAGSCGVITIGTNVAEDVLIQGARITTKGSGGIPIRIIDNNRFQIINNPLISGANATGISLEGASNSLVEGNNIVHIGLDGSKLSDRGGIFVFFRSAAYPAQNNKIRQNTIKGYKTGINDECWGDVNSNNVFEQNTTPNLVHRAANGTWGGRSSGNLTLDKAVAPVSTKQ